VRDTIWVVGVILLLAVTPGVSVFAAEEAAAKNGVRFGETVTHGWEAGVEVTATGGPCRGLFATVPVPTDWPEQSVRIVNEDVSDAVRRVRYRTLDGGVKQMLVSIPLLNARASARALLRFEITRAKILPPADTSIFVTPKKISRNLRSYINYSPFIETRNSSIREKAKELIGESEQAWEQVEAIYDWVRDNVKIEDGQLKGALSAIREGQGSREDAVSLFIALCRAAKIPARTVWVPDHSYAEFYLEDQDRQGYWFPCQIVGKREFGQISETRPIMQKGDSIRVPEKKKPQRFVAEFLRGAGGGGRPTVVFTRRLIRE